MKMKYFNREEGMRIKEHPILEFNQKEKNDYCFCFSIFFHLYFSFFFFTQYSIRDTNIKLLKNITIFDILSLR